MDFSLTKNTTLIQTGDESVAVIKVPSLTEKMYVH